MDKEQAIDLLDNLIGIVEDNQENDYDTALRMAIDALKAQLSKEDTTSDAISRQTVIDLLKQMRKDGDMVPWEGKNVFARIRELPSVQLEERTKEHTETHACDLISRQAAIDIERNATVDTNPSHFEAYQKFTQFMDDAEISSFGRWQWSNGFNTALTAVGIDLKKLPPAQPEDYTELKREFLRIASYIDVLLECSDEQKETMNGFISRLAKFMPWSERD